MNFDKSSICLCENGSTIYLNLFMQSGLFYLNSLDQSISNKKGVKLTFMITMFYIQSKQTLIRHLVLWDARHKWIKCLDRKAQAEQERSEEEISVGDALALAFCCARFCSASLILFASLIAKGSNPFSLFDK